MVSKGIQQKRSSLQRGRSGVLLGCASDFLRLHYRDLNLCANLSFEVLEAEGKEIGQGSGKG